MWGLIYFQVHSLDGWQDSFPHRLVEEESQFFMSYRPEAPLRSLPHGPLHRVTHNVPTGFPQRVSRMGATVFLWPNFGNRIPSPLPYSMHSKQITRSSPPLRGGDNIRAILEASCYTNLQLSITMIYKNKTIPKLWDLTILKGKLTGKLIIVIKYVYVPF